MIGRALRLAPLTGVVVVAIVAATLVALTLRQPDVPTYVPTPAEPRDAGRALVGPVVYTVDATDPDRWTYFSFRLGAAVAEAAPRDWDLAFRRFRILANGGRGFQGEGGILDLGPVSFGAVDVVPDAGYLPNEGVTDPTNAAIGQWYRYGFFSHVLTPKPHVWAVRTADRRYAKLEILGYYCDGGRPGCLTFRYVYQGSGSTAVAAPSARRPGRALAVAQRMALRGIQSARPGKRQRMAIMAKSVTTKGMEPTMTSAIRPRPRTPCTT